MEREKNPLSIILPPHHFNMFNLMLVRKESQIHTQNPEISKKIPQHVRYSLSVKTYLVRRFDGGLGSHKLASKLRSRKTNRLGHLQNQYYD